MFLYVVPLLLCAVTGYALLPYIASFFEALILFILFNPCYLYLKRKTNFAILSAALVMCLTFLIVIVPITLLVPILTQQLSGLEPNTATIMEKILQLQESAKTAIPVSEAFIKAKLPDMLNQLVSKGSQFVLSTIGNLGNAFLNIAIMYILLFFLFINQSVWKDAIQRYWPTKQSALDEINTILHTIVRSVVISTVAIAIIQGGALGVVYAITQTPLAATLGIITCILAFFPIVGAPLIWAPVTLYHFVNQQYTAASITLVVGMIVSNTDGIIRAWIQNKVGAVHPLTTILGVLIGLNLFGFVGLVIGPVMIALSIGLGRMALHEYNA